MDNNETKIVIRLSNQTMEIGMSDARKLLGELTNFFLKEDTPKCKCNSPHEMNSNGKSLKTKTITK